MEIRRTFSKKFKVSTVLLIGIIYLSSCVSIVHAALYNLDVDNCNIIVDNSTGHETAKKLVGGSTSSYYLTQTFEVNSTSTIDAVQFKIAQPSTNGKWYVVITNLATSSYPTYNNITTSRALATSSEASGEIFTSAAANQIASGSLLTFLLGDSQTLVPDTKYYMSIHAGNALSSAFYLRGSVEDDYADGQAYSYYTDQNYGDLYFKIWSCSEPVCSTCNNNTFPLILSTGNKTLITSIFATLLIMIILYGVASRFSYH